MLNVPISSFDDNLNDISSAQTRQDLFANDGSGITADDQLIAFPQHLLKLSVISNY